MLGQVYQIQKITGERVSNVVIMGTGEPLDNYDNFLKFVRLLTDENGLNISQRSVTVSTCGIVPGIRRLAEERNFRLRWRCRCTDLRRKKGKNSCPWRINMSFQRYLPPVTDTLRKPGGG